MKVGVVTFHQALNYGAVLQAYALQRYVKKEFPEVSIDLVDYRCPYLSYLYSTKSKNTGNVVYRTLRKAHFLMKKRLFTSFIKKNISLSAPYTVDTVSEANAVYDRFIVGSDQVWNPNLTDSDINYLLAFADGGKRYSYAASIGLCEIPEKHRERYIGELSRFSHISVRESHAIDTLAAIGIGQGTPAVDHHVDPTLLIGMDEWCSVAAPTRKKQDFVLVFSVDYSKELIDEAVSFAKEKNIPVYYVGQRTSDPNVKYLPLVSVEDLLALLRDASYTFVNSFHGTVFSILFHKRFYTRMVHTDGRNSRIVSLLDKLSLSHKTHADSIDSETDWSAVDAVIEEERQKTKKYVAEIVK